jgi:hypothetical protein
VTTIEKAYAGETVRVQAQIRDWPDYGAEDGTGDLTDPSSASAQLYDPDGDASGSAVAATRSNTGKWYVDITIP